MAGLDLGTTQVFLEADAPRVHCREHGPTVAAVPWARHGAGHTRDFDDTVAWLAVQCSKTAVTELLRVAWRTVGAIVTRVQADIDATVDRLDGLRRIGIDEISYKRGHRYLTVVVDHDTGRLVWAAPGRDEATLDVFFDLLGPNALRADHPRLRRHGRLDRPRRRQPRCPNAVRCADRSTSSRGRTDALDEVRRRAWNDARAVARGEGRRPRAAPAATPHPVRATTGPAP